MARTGITQEQVILAAESLRAQGVNVTIQRVREALGQMGSFTTISRHLEHWRAGDGGAAAAEVIASAPAPVEQLGASLVREVWRAALAETQKDLATAKEIWDREKAELTAKLAEATQEVVRLEGEASAAAAVIQETEESVIKLGQQLAAAEAKDQERKMQLERADTQVAEMTARVSILEEQKRGLEAGRNDAQAEVVRLREQEKLAAEAQAANRELREQLQREQRRNEQVDMRVEKLQAELDAARSSGHAHEKAAATAAASAAELRQRLELELKRGEEKDAQIKASQTKALGKDKG